MKFMERLCCFLLALGSCCWAAAAAQQEPVTPERARTGPITLDVVVDSKAGDAVGSLTEPMFTLLDNKASVPITGFRILGRAADQPPISVTLVIDSVNTPYSSVAFDRQEIGKFLQQNGGKLPYPTTLAVLTDSGLQVQNGYSQDGAALTASLERFTIGLRTIRPSSGIYGADDRLRISLNGLTTLSKRLAAVPGRNIVLWISPGWPILSGPGIELTSRQKDQIFQSVVGASALMRAARMTLYSIDPFGTRQSLIGSTYYQDFLKGIAKPNQVQIGDLALQVLAVQSGGKAFTLNNDLSAQLAKSLSDTDSYYEITFTPPPAERPDEYHTLEIKLNQPGLTARTRTGYYDEP